VNEAIQRELCRCGHDYVAHDWRRENGGRYPCVGIASRVDAQACGCLHFVGQEILWPTPPERRPAGVAS
jgi:hypothetical protein